MSAIVKGPKNGSLNPNEPRTTSSTSSALAIPSSTIRQPPLLKSANWSRFAYEAGGVADGEPAVLPSRPAVERHDALDHVRPRVALVGITSTHGTHCGGLNQCVPRKRSRRSSAAVEPADRDRGGVGRDHRVGRDERLDQAVGLRLDGRVLEDRLEHVSAPSTASSIEPAARTRPVIRSAAPDGNMPAAS